MNAVFFLSNLLAIAMEKIHFEVIAFVCLGYTPNCKNVVIGKWKKEKAPGQNKSCEYRSVAKSSTVKFKNFGSHRSVTNTTLRG